MWRKWHFFLPLLIRNTKSKSVLCNKDSPISILNHIKNRRIRSYSKKEIIPSLCSSFLVSELTDKLVSLETDKSLQTSVTVRWLTWTLNHGLCLLQKSQSRLMKILIQWVMVLAVYLIDQCPRCPPPLPRDPESFSLSWQSRPGCVLKQPQVIRMCGGS